MSLKPRDYQRAAIGAILARRAAGERRTLCVVPTGGGKTVIAAHVADALLPHGRVMVLCHRDELVRQAVDKFTAVTGIVPAVEKAEECSDEAAMFGKPSIVVSSFQTQNSGTDEKGRRMAKFKPSDFAFLWCDECFVAGTPVDGRPIETIRAGDAVPSFNHATGRVERRRVVRTFKSRPSTLVTVRLDNGTAITCTAGHPFFCDAEYRPAGLLRPGDAVHTETRHADGQLHSVRRDVYGRQRAADVLQRVRDRQTERGKEAAAGSRVLCPVRRASVAGRAQGPGHAETRTALLLAGVCRGSCVRGFVGHHEPHEPAVRVGADEASQPDETCFVAGEEFGRTAGNGLGSDRAGRERQGPHPSRADVLRSDGLGADRGADARSAGAGPPNALQDRLWQQGVDDRGGDRRPFPRRGRTPAAGPQERSVLGIARVDSVSIHEPSDRGGYCGLCPDGYVYNLEVDGNHNYFAGGCLVHNCHHAPAESFRRVLDYYTAGNPDLFVLGVTATPDRADGEALGRVFQSCAFNYELPDIVRDGYLVPIRQRSVTIEGLDFSKVRTTAGDLNAGDLEAAMMVEKPLHGIAHATVEIACGLEPGTLAALRDRPDRDAELNHVLLGKRRRRTLVFTVTVAHAERTAEIINRWLPGAAAHVDGTMPMDRRRKILADFAAGTIQFLCNCMVASEGFDEPGVELVVMARPTKSRSLYVQQVGRGTRPHAALAGMLGDLPDAAARRSAIAASAKPSMTVLDFVGNCGRHKLVTAADVLGGEQYDEQVIERAKQKTQGEAVDVAEALAAAQAEIESEQDQARREAMEAQRDADAEEQRRQADAARRAGLVGTAVYQVRDVDGFDPYAVEAERRSEVSDGGATEPQIGFLVKLGVRRETAATYSKRQAGAVITSLKAKRCTDPQAHLLRRFGYSREEIEGMNFDAASSAIEAAKANNGRQRGAAA